MKEYFNLMPSKCDSVVPAIVDAHKLQQIARNLKGCAIHEESTLHQMAPYIGKIKSSTASVLISSFLQPGQTLYDPFCGSGTIPLEGWIAGLNVIATDLNPYAFVLTKAKMNPPYDICDVLQEIDCISEVASKKVRNIDLRKVPKWVRSFFHPKTLREIIAWIEILASRKSYFILACLLGILHHQRPGFLSYPSSHAVPYLRDKKYPRDQFPELYNYRSLKDRLIKKVHRVFKRLPRLNYNLERQCYMKDAGNFKPEENVHAIITSPPYMRNLDYGRDNRLRLWFLGYADWLSLDRQVSPSESNFINLINACLRNWHDCLHVDGLCIIILGDSYVRSVGLNLPKIVTKLATCDIGGYSKLSQYTESVPNHKRIRKNYKGTLNETILILQKR